MPLAPTPSLLCPFNIVEPIFASCRTEDCDTAPRVGCSAFEPVAALPAGDDIASTGNEFPELQLHRHAEIARGQEQGGAPVVPAGGPQRNIQRRYLDRLTGVD